MRLATDSLPLLAARLRFGGPGGDSPFVAEFSVEVDVFLSGLVLELVGGVLKEVLDAGGELRRLLHLVLEL